MYTLGAYFITNIFLFLFSGYLLFRTTPDLLKKREYLSFKIFVLSFCFYLIANSLWTMNEFDIISLPKWLFVLVCSLSLASVSFTCYCFYKFAMIYFGFSKHGNRLYDFFAIFPFFVAIILLIISIFNQCIFYISDEGKLVQGPLYFALFIIAFIYFAIILTSSLIVFIKSKSPTSRKNYITILFLVIFLVSWVIADNFFDSLTILPIAIFSVILVLFTTFQHASINTDALTQMNNRRKATEYLTSQLSNVSNENPLYLYLCDINSFKSINDNYGHIEGDNALIIFAESIKSVVSSVSGFAARYGGDEFVIAIKNNSKNYDMKAIISKIEDIARDRCQKENKPYVISVAFGCKLCTDPKESFEEYIKDVDNLLYQQKRKTV